MERIPPICLFLFMCCLTPAALYAQNGSDSLTRKAYPDSLRHYSIDEVTVYGQNQPSRIIPAQELSGKELQRLNALSVADAVRYFSGVQIKDYGGIGGLKTINIRSMGTQHVGVFFDGIQLGNAQNGQIDLGRFSLDNMESISLYNGQKSAVFQPAKDFASAGSIYMQTRTPRFDRDGKNNHFGVSMKTGSFGTANPSILWEHRFNDRLSSSFNVEYLYTTGRYKFSYTKKTDTTRLKCAATATCAPYGPKAAFSAWYATANGKRKSTFTTRNGATRALRCDRNPDGSGTKTGSGTTTFSYRVLSGKPSVRFTVCC